MGETTKVGRYIAVDIQGNYALVNKETGKGISWPSPEFWMVEWHAEDMNKHPDENWKI